LQRDVEATRRRGWAVNDEEWVPGLCVVGAPILGRGPLRGVLVAAVPSARFAEIGADALGRRIAAAGRKIAARLEGGSS
jgi:IclR family acetate operon transcriptional repressor